MDFEGVLQLWKKSPSRSFVRDGLCYGKIIVWTTALRVDVGVDGVLFDEFAAGTYVVAHEHGEDIVSVSGIFE